MSRKKILWGAAAFTGVLIAAVFFLFLHSDVRKKQKQEITDIRTIRVMAPYSAGVHKKTLEAAAQGYEKDHPETAVEIEYIPEENYKREIGLRQDEENNADIIICSSSAMPPLIQMGVFRELQMTPEKRNRYVQGIPWENVMDDGKYYGLPFFYDPYLLFYNKKSIEENQVDPPSTWEEIIQAGARIQTLGTYGFGFAAKNSEETAQFFSMMLYSRGGSIYSLDRAQGIQCFQDIQDMVQMNILPANLINTSQEDLARRFAEGEVHMMVNQLSCLTVLKSSGTSMEIGMTRVPGEITDMIYLTGQNIGLTVNAREEAEDFLDYLFEPEVYESMCNSMDMLPVLHDIAYEEKDTAEYTGGTDLRTDFLEGTNEKFSLVSDAWFSVAEVLGDQVRTALERDSEEPEAIARETQEAVRLSILEN